MIDNHLIKVKENVVVGQFDVEVGFTPPFGPSVDG